MQCFIVATEDSAAGATLAAILGELGFAFEREPSLGQLRGSRRFAEAVRPVVLVPEESGAALADVAGFAADHAGYAFAVYLADTIAPADYKRLVRTGAADWMAPHGCRDELRELATRVAVAEIKGRAAKIVSFVPSKGGVGTTTVAVETAAQWAGRRKRQAPRVALLDLHLQGGTLADALDLEPRLDLSEIVDRPERLDEQLIDIFTSRYAKTLDVFASPRSWLSLDALKPDVVFTFIDAISTRYDTLVLDLPAQWASWTDTLLSGSDAVVVCGSESVPGLRHLTATLGHLDKLSLAPAKVAAVVNAVETDLLGRPARRGLIARALAERKAFLVRRDPAGAGQALDVGKPLSELSPHGKVAHDIKPLTAWIEAVLGEAPGVRTAAPALREAVA